MQNSDTQSINDKEQREKNFDEFYQEKVREIKNEKERIAIVCERLTQKYEKYDQTKAFIEYLRSVEGVFSSAEDGMWSVEKTEREMIKSEIYLMSRTTGIDEGIFHGIYEEFKQTSHNVQKIQEIAQQLVEKYSNIKDCWECDDCKEFIMYVRDALLIFAKSIGGNEEFDEISEVKDEIIKKQMERFSRDSKPPLEILKDIYKEFTELLKV